MAGTQGIGVFGINSKFASGSLVFYEKAVGRTATGDVFTIGTAAVKVGGTSQDVDFQVYGTGSLSAIIDIGAATFTMVGLTSSTDKPLTISDTTESTSTTTGALIVSGGIGFAKDMYVGDDVFLTSAAKLDWAAGNALLTHSTGLLTFSASNVAFGVDATGVDVTFFGDTASAQVIWDMSEDDLIWKGVARAIMGTSGTALVLTQGSPILDIYTTCASTHASNSVNSVHVKTTMTGAAGVGGRALFEMTTNVALGGWSNALKAYTEYGASGSTTGLGSALCAEILLSAGTTSGTYAPLESELVADSAVSSGTATSFLYGNIAGSDGTGKTTLNTNGYLFELGAGVVDTSNGLFDVVNIAPTTVNFDANLKIRIGGVDYFIPLSADNAFE